MDFREHIRTKLLKKNDRILEFGPLNWPIVTKEHYPNVRYSDIRNSNEVKKLYASNDYLESTGIKIDVKSIVDIDYVIDDNYKKTFKGVEKFDAVILGHVIEHIPDIIFFFQDVMNVLKKHGKLIIIYPDARYCFDHFRNGTTFIDAYDVYENSKNSSKRVFDFVYNVVHENRPTFFWGDEGLNKILPKNKFDDALVSYEKAKNNELPDDTHFWPFADYQFVKFLYDMDRAGLLDLNIVDFYETQHNTQEFMIILSPKTKKSINYSKYQKILSTTHPVDRARIALSEKENLQTRLTELEGLIKQKNTELTNIYESKKWRVANKAAKVKTLLTPKSKDL